MVGEETSATASVSARRGRGQSAGLDLARIVKAARGMEPKSLSMQGVANRLGVDRTALHHYVADREQLLALVAADAFASSLARIVIDAGLPWQDGCRLLARATRDSVVGTGSLASYLRFGGTTDADLLAPAEAVLQHMVEAGFTEESAGRGLYTLSVVAMSLARERVLVEHSGGHPQVQELNRVLATAGESKFPVLRRLQNSEQDAFGDQQFDYSVNMVIDGMEAQLVRERRTPPAEI